MSSSAQRTRAGSSQERASAAAFGAEGQRRAPPSWEKLYQRGLVAAAKQQLAHEERVEVASNGELEECTFHPHINRTSRTIAVTGCATRDDFFSKLFQDAATLRKRREEKAEQQRAREAMSAAEEHNKLKELNQTNRKNLAGGADPPAVACDDSPVFDRLTRKRLASTKHVHLDANNACTFQPNSAAARSASQQRRIDALCSAARRRQQLQEEAKAGKNNPEPNSGEGARRLGTAERSSRGPSPTARPAGSRSGSHHALPTESSAQMQRDKVVRVAGVLTLPPDEPLTLQQLYLHNLQNAARNDLPQPTRPDWYLP
jgi:hypothetical protein